MLVEYGFLSATMGGVENNSDERLSVKFTKMSQWEGCCNILY